MRRVFSVKNAGVKVSKMFQGFKIVLIKTPKNVFKNRDVSPEFN